MARPADGRALPTRWCDLPALEAMACRAAIEGEETIHPAPHARVRQLGQSHIRIIALSGYLFPNASSSCCPSDRIAQTIPATASSSCSRRRALAFSHIQLNAPMEARWLAFDIDRDTAALAWEEGGLQAPNVIG